MTKSTSDMRTPFAPEFVAGSPASGSEADARRAFAREFARSDVRLTADQTRTAAAPPEPASDPAAAVSDLAARVAASIAPRPLPEPSPGGFGVTQRWTLTRLAFTRRDASVTHAPSFPGIQRIVVVRPTFIAAADLAAWRHAPPADAHALPPDADAIVDGITAEGATAFYAVLEAVTPDDPSDPSAPATWHSLPLMPILPPFETAEAPFVLGPARARIEAFARTAPASPELAALIAAALRGLG